MKQAKALWSGHIKKSVILITIIAFLEFVIAVSPAAAQGESFDRLVGSWRCSGHFVASNKPIASRITIQRDEATNAFIVHHDDDPPAAYHALEIWTATGPSGFRASMVDAYSGTRWFSAIGWAGSGLTWRRPSEGAVLEQFAYTLETPDQVRVDWSIARKDGTLTLGDTLRCRRDV